MSRFYDLTPTNGFDIDNLNNARQNNYAWSMSDLEDYIYVGTGRNIPFTIIKAIEPATQIPALIKPDPVDNRAEIWRYKKDGSLPWERVYKASADSGIIGFRYMIKYQPFGGSPCLYAATFGSQAKVLKSTNGVNWFILPDNTIQGASSRAMVVQQGKLYLSTVDEVNQNPAPLLYSSEDPEFYPWESLINVNAPDFDPTRNPTSPISDMAVFNNRIYIGVSNSEGAQVWRTNGPVPKQNDWTLIVDQGFGDPSNVYTLSMGVFRDYLYVSGTKELPLSWAIPRGCDVIRINKYDNWELIVGGNPFLPSTAGNAMESASHLYSGFNNPFNVYAWQIQEFDGKLLISTFDDSSNMELILNILLANRIALEQLIGLEVTRILIEIYESVVDILRVIRYPIGFDLYVSEDGIHFSSVFLNGLHNPNNYGGRILYVDSCGKLCLGTANPFQGCEVWVANRIDNCDSELRGDNHYRGLQEIRNILTEKYDIINENMPAVLSFIPKEYYGRFF